MHYIVPSRVSGRSVLALLLGVFLSAWSGSPAQAAYDWAYFSSMNGGALVELEAHYSPGSHDVVANVSHEYSASLGYSIESYWGSDLLSGFYGLELTELNEDPVEDDSDEWGDYFDFNTGRSPSDWLDMSLQATLSPGNYYLNAWISAHFSPGPGPLAEERHAIRALIITE